MAELSVEQSISYAEILNSKIENTGSGRQLNRDIEDYRRAGLKLRAKIQETLMDEGVPIDDARVFAEAAVENFAREEPSPRTDQHAGVVR